MYYAVVVADKYLVQKCLSFVVVVVDDVVAVVTSEDRQPPFHRGHVSSEVMRLLKTTDCNSDWNNEDWPHE